MQQTVETVEHKCLDRLLAIGLLAANSWFFSLLSQIVTAWPTSEDVIITNAAISACEKGEQWTQAWGRLGLAERTCPSEVYGS